ADDRDPPAGDLLEVAADAADRAAGADARHEVGDAAVGLLPDLRAGGQVVAVGVLRVGVLVGLPGAGDLAGQPVGDGVVGVGMVGRDGRGADHDLRAVGPQYRDLVLCHLVRHHEQAAVPLPLRD